MTEQKTSEAQNAWTGADSSQNGGETWRWQRSSETSLNRFLGGSPLHVALRLFALSLVVGALLMWLDIRPADVIAGVVHFVHRIWAMGFDALRQLGDYLIAGALIVVPIWFILRLLNFRGPR